jgi:carboxylesterase type B
VNFTEKNREAINCNGVRATFIDEKYGEHERNNFDIWLADSAQPTPLVIYIHGGGFIGGDKSKYYPSEDLARFLEADVSVAVINYRFQNDAPYGILASMNDAKRCIQYIRYYSGKYNIDKTRVACSGGSAGAGISLWLAFNSEMTEPKSNDPVLRESTRLTCAGAFETQATYDVYKWNELLKLPGEVTESEEKIIARAFGFKLAIGRNLKQETVIRNQLDLLSQMDKNSAPFFVFNKKRGGFPTNKDELNHHPLHARALKERAEKVGVAAIVYAPEIGIVDKSGKDLVEFFLEEFKK